MTAVVVVVAVAPDDAVVAVVPDAAPAAVVVVVPGVAVVDGWMVATNGVRSGLGRTKGMSLTANVRVGVPNWTVMVPDALTFCTVPAESAPAHKVDPEAEDVT